MCAAADVCRQQYMWVFSKDGHTETDHQGVPFVRRNAVHTAGCTYERYGSEAACTCVLIQLMLNNNLPRWGSAPACLSQPRTEFIMLSLSDLCSVQAGQGCGCGRGCECACVCPN